MCLLWQMVVAEAFTNLSEIIYPVGLVMGVPPKNAGKSQIVLSDFFFKSA
jgi:hypothetical protein